MPRAGEGGDEAVGNANVVPEEVAPWEIVKQEALTEVDAEKGVEEVALQSGVVWSCRMLGCTRKRRDLRSAVWMAPTRIDVCERSTSPMCLQTPQPNR